MKKILSLMAAIAVSTLIACENTDQSVVDPISVAITNVELVNTDAPGKDPEPAQVRQTRGASSDVVFPVLGVLVKVYRPDGSLDLIASSELNIDDRSTSLVKYNDQTGKIDSWVGGPLTWYGDTCQYSPDGNNNNDILITIRYCVSTTKWYDGVYHKTFDKEAIVQLYKDAGFVEYNSGTDEFPIRTLEGTKETAARVQLKVDFEVNTGETSK